jgi:hypothetical protein
MDKRENHISITVEVSVPDVVKTYNSGAFAFERIKSESYKCYDVKVVNNVLTIKKYDVNGNVSTYHFPIHRVVNWHTIEKETLTVN